ncbi:MAG: hypothetical protein EA425_09695 [Puniceicoccaceae bacterium]|nr:MAG: hypothetical protein EA425_09695 [Puniceicoccaceae bacterium]
MKRIPFFLLLSVALFGSSLQANLDLTELRLRMEANGGRLALEVRDVVRAHPESAGVIINLAQGLFPDQICDIVKAAIQGDPRQTAAIVRAAVLQQPELAEIIIQCAEEEVSRAEIARLMGLDPEGAREVVRNAGRPDSPPGDPAVGPGGGPPAPFPFQPIDADTVSSSG